MLSLNQIKEVWLQKKDVEKLYDWVEENRPYEACAIMLGKIEQGIAYVDEVILTPNTSKSSVHFEIDPELLLKIYLKAEEKKKSLVAIFHSHPTSPYPSGVDVPYMQHNPGTVWLIKGLPETAPMHAFQWYNQKVVEVRVRITHLNPNS